MVLVFSVFVLAVCFIIPTSSEYEKEKVKTKELSQKAEDFLMGKTVKVDFQDLGRFQGFLAEVAERHPAQRQENQAKLNKGINICLVDSVTTTSLKQK
jgi:hypothetical protein